MKTPIILISAKGETKEQFLKEYREAIRNFLKAEKEVEQKKHQESSPEKK